MNRSAFSLLPGIAVFFGFIIACAVPAAAQTMPRAEFSGGYQLISLSTAGESESFPKGWYADIAGNLNETFGIVFEVGGNYKSVTETVRVGTFTSTATVDIKIHEFMGGLRMSGRTNPIVVPYGQILGGAANGSAKVSVSSAAGGANLFSAGGAESGTNAALQLGGGVVIAPGGKVGVRIGADYVRIFASDEDANAFRLGAGVNIPF